MWQEVGEIALSMGKSRVTRDVSPSELGSEPQMKKMFAFLSLLPPSTNLSVAEIV